MSFVYTFIHYTILICRHHLLSLLCSLVLSLSLLYLFLPFHFVWLVYLFKWSGPIEFCVWWWFIRILSIVYVSSFYVHFAYNPSTTVNFINIQVWKTRLVKTNEKEQKKKLVISSLKDLSLAISFSLLHNELLRSAVFNKWSTNNFSVSIWKGAKKSTPQWRGKLRFKDFNIIFLSLVLKFQTNLEQGFLGDGYSICFLYFVVCIFDAEFFSLWMYYTHHMIIMPYSILSKPPDMFFSLSL